MVSINKLADWLNDFPMLNPDLQTGIPVYSWVGSNPVLDYGTYPGDAWCNPQKQHSKWHVESANGLMDLMMLSDNMFRLTMYIIRIQFLYKDMFCNKNIQAKIKQNTLLPLLKIFHFFINVSCSPSSYLNIRQQLVTGNHPLFVLVWQLLSHLGGWGREFLGQCRHQTCLEHSQ